MAIKILPEQVINQIAAGEVVERPASVVKELVDNALDSGTKRVAVSISSGGLSLIQVTDHGSGMNRDDALLAFERHATSKITTLSDLDTICTNGFRGEALSSISSVASVSLKTKRKDDQTGTMVEIRGGKMLNVTPVAATDGTSIEVKNLFFNVPARKKFLKSERVEEAKIIELICAYALAYWDIDFELQSNQKIILSLPSNSDQISRCKRVIKGNTIEVGYNFDEVKVSGLLGHPGSATAQGSSLTILVNKRFVHDKFILRAVKEGFSSTLKDREFPVGVVEVTLPGHLVDVNVHPQKSEVRFSNPQKIFAAVKTAVEESVRHFRSAQPAIANFETNTYRTNSQSWMSLQPSADYSASPAIANTRTDLYQTLSSSAPVASFEPKKLIDGASEQYKFLGQIFKCYLFFEGENKLLAVDMHAAHERVQYNRIMKSYRENQRHSQALLIPSQIKLTDIELATLSEISHSLEEFGFEIKLGNDYVEVIAVPVALQRVSTERLIKELVQLDDGSASTFAIEETLAYRCARIACHASFRGGDVISREDSYALLEQVLSSDFGAACPHGRPCLVEFKKEQIETWFGRDK